LQKVAQFAKISVNKVSELEDEVHELRVKTAAEDAKRARFNSALEKAARILYEADFITDDLDKRKFLKRAKEDPSYLVDVLEKVCNAADVALIGSPARVAARTKQAEYDPVYARAFGYNQSSVIDG
jgi:hypothetical protein